MYKCSGNNISTNQIVKDVLIQISEQEYTTNLVILSGLGIDVILGMNWMKNHGVLIDTSTRTVMLRDPKNNEAFLYPFLGSLISIMWPMLSSLWPLLIFW